MLPHRQACLDPGARPGALVSPGDPVCGSMDHFWLTLTSVDPLKDSYRLKGTRHSSICGIVSHISSIWWSLKQEIFAPSFTTNAAPFHWPLTILKLLITANLQTIAQHEVKPVAIDRNDDINRFHTSPGRKETQERYPPPSQPPPPRCSGAVFGLKRLAYYLHELVLSISSQTFSFLMPQTDRQTHWLLLVLKGICFIWFSFSHSFSTFVKLCSPHFRPELR